MNTTRQAASIGEVGDLNKTALQLEKDVEREIAEARAVEEYMATPVKTSDANETINDFGSGKEKIRTVLVEFVKFQSPHKGATK